MHRSRMQPLIRNGSYYERRFGALSSLLCAFRAQTVELDLVPGHFESKGPVEPSIQALIGRDIEVDDGIAFLADEMIMGLCIGIESIKSASKSNPVDESLLHKNANVPIDGPQAEIGEFLAQFAKEPVCGWMSFVDRSSSRILSRCLLRRYGVCFLGVFREPFMSVSWNRLYHSMRAR